LEREEEAIAQCEQVLAINPDDVEALSRRGQALAKLDRHPEAVASLDRALSIDPDHPSALDGLLRSAADACDWAIMQERLPDLVARVGRGISVEAFSLLAYNGDPSLHRACAERYVDRALPVRPAPLWSGAVWRNPKIKLAYVASGFHRHPTAYLTAELFEIHDRSRFEVLGFSLGPDDKSDIRERIKRGVDKFYDVAPQTDEEVAKLINDMQVDIVIDRSGHTSNSRLSIFAHRPAPIQVNYIGYPGTLGADFYDYVIADRIILPFDQQPFYVEKIMHLPDSYLVNDSKRPIAAETPTRQDVGLPAEGFVFCCFNKSSKITLEMFDIWMRLLRRVEGSVLWLLGTHPFTEENLGKAAAARGVDPARLVYAKRVQLDRHLARHRLADLFLDTLPYNAHTTASDALWVELPVVTCLGEAYAGRVAASLLEAIGLPELVTHSLDDYEALALRLATEPSLLAAFRDRLSRNRLSFPLFDSDRYRRHIEAAYTTMWELWQRGESPRNFAIAPGDPCQAVFPWPA
jgi:predicted O-linked N-acetylglucosamine transferase (SPINDLY family)